MRMKPFTGRFLKPYRSSIINAGLLLDLTLGLELVTTIGVHVDLPLKSQSFFKGSVFSRSEFSRSEFSRSEFSRSELSRSEV